MASYWRGRMLSTNNTTEISNLKPKTYPSHIEVRLVTNKARAGYTDSYYADEYLKDLPVVLVEADKEYKGKYMAFEVDGNSMPPQIQPGDWLRCEEISSLFWLEKNFFKKDKIYCIWHNSRGIIFKRLIYKNSGEIWCSSDNEDKLEFPDFPLEIEKVNKILVVRSLVDRKF